MTIFDLWPIPLGGGAWGSGTNMWHPETPASYESLPAPLATQIPTLWLHTFGGGGVGGSDIRSMSSIRPICNCRCPPLIERNVPHLTYFGGEGKFSLRLRQQQLYFSLAAMEIGQGTCSFPLQRSKKTTSTTRLLNTAEIYYLVLGCAGFAEKICFRFKAKFIRFASKNNFFTSLRFTVFISNKRCFIPYPEFWVFPILDPGSRITDPWSQIFLVKQFFSTFSFRFDFFALLRLFPVHFCYRCLLFHLPPERDDFIIHFHTGWCARQTVCRKLFTWSFLKEG